MPVCGSFAGVFSGLLGGVLKGETRSSENVPSGRGVSDPDSWRDNMAGLTGIFGLSTLLTGGGSEALFDFRSVGVPSPLTVDAPSVSRGTVVPTGTEDPNCGVVGRCGGAGEMPVDKDARGR